MRGQVPADGSHCGTVRGAARDRPFGRGAEFHAPGMGMDGPIDECAEFAPYGQTNFGRTFDRPWRSRYDRRVGVARRTERAVREPGIVLGLGPPRADAAPLTTVFVLGHGGLTTCGRQLPSAYTTCPPRGRPTAGEAPLRAVVTHPADR